MPKCSPVAEHGRLNVSNRHLQDCCVAPPQVAAGAPIKQQPARVGCWERGLGWGWGGEQGGVQVYRVSSHCYGAGVGLGGQARLSPGPAATDPTCVHAAGSAVSSVYQWQCHLRAVRPSTPKTPAGEVGHTQHVGE